MYEDWKPKYLSDLVELRNGVNFTRAASGQAVKVVGVAHFRDREVLSDFADVDSVILNGGIAQDDLLSENDLLFVRSNGNKALIGRCLLIKDITEPVAFSGFTIRARITSDEVDPDFLSRVVRSPLFKQHLHREGGGSSISNLSQKTLAEFSFLLPSLPEQLRIVEILRAWDAALERLQALRKANHQRSIWFRNELFSGKRRLPGFTDEWCEVRLSEVLTEHSLRSAGTEEVFSVSVHKGLVNQIEHLGRSYAASETAHYNRVLPGDVVYTKSPTGDFPLGIIKQSKIDREVIVSPLYGVFTPATYDLGVILDAYFESPVTVWNYLHTLVQKGAKNTISITNTRFLAGKLRLPLDPNEQKAIAEVVETSRRERAAIETQIRTVAQQKQALLQKLLTGSVRAGA
ncbi:restriction endonuclease subunit S [Streptomyces longwoodensis]|uniref:restriction endonuclease subunit S n=1 Tax=Streptomyces longwoodensis TaxID=68231 RepID=UPI0036FC20BF